jgi:conjugal transfer pilus assembly protein TraV
MIRHLGSVLALAAAALSGCASTLSGLGGTETYACKAPDGVMCKSVSGVYANSIQGPLRPTQSAPEKPASGAPSTYRASPLAPPTAPGAATSAIRSNPRLLRVWIAPWQDSDGDLHEAGYVHMLVDAGRWLIEHVRPAPRRNLDGASPPPAARAPESPASKTPAGNEGTPVE